MILFVGINYSTISTLAPTFLLDTYQRRDKVLLWAGTPQGVSMFNDRKPDPIRQRVNREMDYHIRRQIEAMREHNRAKREEEERKKSER